jgi:ketosteroid isomerase-like protein
MKSPTRWILGLLVLPVAACAPSAPGVDLEAETEALRAAAQAYHDAARVQDTEAVTALYAPDGIIYAPDTPTIQGTDGIYDFAAGFASVPGIQVELDLAEVVVSSSGDMGYTLGVGRITMDGPEGEPVVEDIRDFHVWHKDAEGAWKLVVDIWNSPVPLEPAG